MFTSILVQLVNQILHGRWQTFKIFGLSKATKVFVRSCVKKPRCDPPSTRLQHISLVIFRLRSQNIVMYILHPLTNARKVHLRAQKMGLKKSLQTTVAEENRDLSFLSYIWSTLDNKNVLFSVALLRKRLNKTMQGVPSKDQYVIRGRE